MSPRNQGARVRTWTNSAGTGNAWRSRLNAERRLAWPCRSGLAGSPDRRDGRTAVHQANRAVFISGKPAPTGQQRTGSSGSAAALLDHPPHLGLARSSYQVAVENSVLDHRITQHMQQEIRGTREHSAVEHQLLMDVHIRPIAACHEGRKPPKTTGQLTGAQRLSAISGENAQRFFQLDRLLRPQRACNLSARIRDGLPASELHSMGSGQARQNANRILQ
ncbi:hypothetical protein D9M71_271130 [compost metagenome]